MKWQFSKYAVPAAIIDEFRAPGNDWGWRAENLFCPDQVLEAVYEELQSRWSAYEKQLRAAIKSGEIQLNKNNRILIPGFEIDLNQTVSLVRDTLSRLDPDGGLSARFVQTISLGWTDMQKVDPAMGTEGSCPNVSWQEPVDGRPATIKLSYDGTVSDPVYLVHEAGHNEESAFTYKRRGRELPGNITEMHAFFAQCAFYDPSLHPERPPALAKAIALHKYAEFGTLLAFWEQERDDLIQARLAPPARRQEVDFADMLWNRIRRTHHYRGPFIIAAALYEKFKDMAAPEKKTFLAILYGHDSEPSLNSILAGAGICDEKSLKELIQNGVRAVTVQPEENFMERRRVLSPVSSI